MKKLFGIFSLLILCTACSSSKPVSLGDTFHSGDFQITIGTHAQIVSGFDGNNILNLVRIPMNITNNSSDTASLNEEKIIYFGNDSSQDKSIMSDVAENDSLLLNIKAGGTVFGAFYMPYSDDGIYSMEIEGQEINVDIILPETITNKDFLNCITRNDIRNSLSQLIDDIGCKDVQCSINDKNIVLTIEPVVTYMENNGGYFRCKNAVVSCQTNMSACRAETIYSKFTCVIKNSILSDGSVGDIVFEYDF